MQGQLLSVLPRDIHPFAAQLTSVVLKHFPNTDCSVRPNVVLPPANFLSASAPVATAVQQPANPQQSSRTSAQLATHLNVSKRQVNRQIKGGMPNTYADADAWRAARPGSAKVQGVAKRKKVSGELTAKALAEAVGISATRVQQLWTSGMSRTYVQSAQTFRALRIEQSSSNPANSVDFAACHDSRAKSAATHEDEVPATAHSQTASMGQLTLR